MDTVKPKRWASARWNGDFYLIETFSGYRLYRRDPAGKQYTLPPGSSDRDLGAALLDALAHSRFFSLDEARVFNDHKKGQEQYADWIGHLMTRHGYKTKQALFKNMATCHIEVAVDEERMKIAPMHHDRLESWSRTKDDDIEDVFLRADSSPDTVGQALLLAFSRCT